LREVLRAYQDLYGENLARAALRKSSNLVVSSCPVLFLPTLNRSKLTVSKTRAK
jgi:hypothetical protein